MRAPIRSTITLDSARPHPRDAPDLVLGRPAGRAPGTGDGASSGSPTGLPSGLPAGHP